MVSVSYLVIIRELFLEMAALFAVTVDVKKSIFLAVPSRGEIDQEKYRAMEMIKVVEFFFSFLFL